MISLADVEVHAGNPITHAVMLLVDYERLLFIIILVNPNYPLWMIERYGLINLFINELLDIPFVFDSHWHLTNRQVDYTLNVMIILPIIVSKDLDHRVPQLIFCFNERFCSFLSELIVILVDSSH